MTPARLDFVDALRGLAALAVVAVTAVSLITYCAAERPGMALGSRIIGRKG